jgi:hypothetical protein
LAVDRGRLENQLSDLIFPPKTNAANERLAQHLWSHRDQLFTFLRQPGLDATNWRAELAIRFGVILRKVWGGNRTWAGGAGTVGPDVSVADLLAAGAVGPGPPQSTPSRRAGDSGLAPRPTWREPTRLERRFPQRRFADMMRQSNAPAGGRDV